MKFGLIPTSLFERVALAFGKVPVPMLDAVFGPMKARAVMAGVTLGLFDALRDGARTASALASQLDLDVETLEMLLRLLVVSDYLVQQGDGFALSRLARRTMLSDAPMAMVGYLRFNYTQWALMGHLEEVVRTGRGRDIHLTMTPDQWRDYQQGMFEIARMESAIVAALVPVRPAAERLLDIAGAHGLFGAAICRRHPPMRCTVLDLPHAVPHARALAVTEHLTDVVAHVEGDVLTSDLGHHDVLLLCNVLHHFSRDVVGSIVARAHHALEPDGTVAIWEFESPRPGSRATAVDAAALFFRVTSTGGAYHGDEYARWLRDVGFRGVTITRPLAAPGKVLVTARR